MKDIRIVARLTEKEKKKIVSLAEKSKLSVSEYMKRCALGYKPAATSLEYFSAACKEANDLIDKCGDLEVKTKILNLLEKLEVQIFKAKG